MDENILRSPLGTGRNAELKSNASNVDLVSNLMSASNAKLNYHTPIRPFVESLIDQGYEKDIVGIECERYLQVYEQRKDEIINSLKLQLDVERKNNAKNKKIMT